MLTVADICADIQASGKPVPFMLIDCAGLSGGAAQLPRQAFTKLECLFTGDSAVELVDVGPYLGQLRDPTPAVVEVAEDLLFNQVAVMVVLKKDGLPIGDAQRFAQMYRHFRKFNVVQGPDGESLFFRYADSRVLIDVLAVLDNQQLEEFFGDIDLLVISKPNTRLLELFGRGKGGLARRTLINGLRA